MDTDYVKSLNFKPIPFMVKIPIYRLNTNTVSVFTNYSDNIDYRSSPKSKNVEINNCTNCVNLLLCHSNQKLTLGSFLEWGLKLVFLTFLCWGVLKAGPKNIIHLLGSK